MQPRPQADALMDLLFPAWQLVIGAMVAVVVAVVGLRLARQGRSRMRKAMVVVGAGILGLTLFGVLQATVTRG
jgi:FtsH-binding integral membrane protein